MDLKPEIQTFLALANASLAWTTSLLLTILALACGAKRDCSPVEWNMLYLLQKRNICNEVRTKYEYSWCYSLCAVLGFAFGLIQVEYLQYYNTCNMDTFITSTLLIAYAGA